MDEIKEVEELLEVGESSPEQIAEFLSDESVENEEVAEPSTESVEEKASAEEPTEKVVETASEEEKEVVDKTKTEPESEVSIDEVPIDEVTKLKTQIESLQVLVDKLAGPPAVKTEEPPVPTKIKELAELLEEVDFDSVMESKENFSKFFLTAMQAVQEQTAQKILSSIPNIVGSHVQRQTTLRDVATEFYTRYPELKRVKRYVGTVANEIYAANPEMTLGQVMEEAAKVAKETLNIQAVVETREKEKASKPALPGSGGGARSPQKATSKLQSEIDSLLSD